MVLEAQKFKTEWPHLKRASCCIITWQVALQGGRRCDSGEWHVWWEIANPFLKKSTNPFMRTQTLPQGLISHHCHGQNSTWVFFFGGGVAWGTNHIQIIGFPIFQVVHRGQKVATSMSKDQEPESPIKGWQRQRQWQQRGLRTPCPPDSVAY